MQMETKYKAWIKDEKKMVPVEKLWFPLKPFPMRAIECDNGRGFGIDEVELIPYTGLKDKNGKEIYEGDIISHYGEYALIIWDEDKYRLKWLSESCYYHEDLCFWANKRKISVIGNIFENRELIDNPELLQEEQCRQ